MTDSDIKVKTLPRKSKLNRIIRMPAIALGTVVCIVTIICLGISNRNIRLEASEAQRLRNLDSTRMNSALGECANTLKFLVSSVPKVKKDTKIVEVDTLAIPVNIDKLNKEHQAAIKARDQEKLSIGVKLKEAAKKIKSLNAELKSI